MPDDPDHGRVRAFFREASRNTRFVTSNLILSEALTWLRYKSSHATAVRLRRAVLDAEKIGLLRIAWVTPDVHDRAWEIFERYDDQVFSFCDCTSFVLARDEDIDFVFGFDSDFATMGFDLRPGPA